MGVTPGHSELTLPAFSQPSVVDSLGTEAGLETSAWCFPYLVASKEVGKSWR